MSAKRDDNKSKADKKSNENKSNSPKRDKTKSPEKVVGGDATSSLFLPYKDPN